MPHIFLSHNICSNDCGKTPSTAPCVLDHPYVSHCVRRYCPWKLLWWSWGSPSSTRVFKRVNVFPSVCQFSTHYKLSVCSNKFVFFLLYSLKSSPLCCFAFSFLMRQQSGKSYKLFIHWLLAEILWMLINSCDVWSIWYLHDVHAENSWLWLSCISKEPIYLLCLWSRRLVHFWFVGKES